MTAIVFASLLLQVVDFMSELAAWSTHKASAVKQVLAWAGGVALIAVAAHAAVTAALVLPGTNVPLGSLDGPSVVLVGLLVSSLGSTGRDLLNAVDNRNTDYLPPLFGPPTPPAG